MKITELKLHVNKDGKISELPDSIGKLTNLTELDLYSDRGFSEFPECIGQLKNLTTLNLNKLSELPQSIGQLKNLTSLNLRYTMLGKLHTSINQKRVKVTI